MKQPQHASDPSAHQTVPVLDLRQAREGDRVVVSVIGEVDLATATKLRSCLEEVVGSGVPVVTVDMAKLDFIDSVGLSVLVDAARLAEHRGVGFVLRSPQRATQKVLRFSGLADLLTIEDPADTD